MPGTIAPRYSTCPEAEVAIDAEKLDEVADVGYLEGEEILINLL